MSAQEELQEHVQHAHDKFDKTVAGCMAIIAACLAVVSVLGQHYNTEKLLSQQQASDQWAYYQAKDVRRYIAVVAADELKQNKAEAALSAKYDQDATRYRQQNAAIQDRAHEFEAERDKTGHEADSFHIGEVFLELAIVMSSLSILTKRRPLFYGGLIGGIAGVIVSSAGYIWYGLMNHP